MPGRAPTHSLPAGLTAHTTLARYAALGRRSDESLDQLVHIATAITGTTLGVVGLLADDGGWFDGAIGLEPARAAALFPFCGYVLFRGQPFELPDLRTSDRFADDRHVTGEPGLRLFAGAPLHGRSGTRIGALCVFDVVARTLSDPEREGLAAMARQIEMQLQLRKEFDKLRDRHSEQLERIQMLEGVLRAADRFAILSTDENGVIRSFNHGAEQMLGYGAAEVLGRWSPLAFHDPEELAAYAARLSTEAGNPVLGFEVLVARARLGVADEREWTWRRRDGSSFPVSVLVAAARSEENDLTGFVVIAQDLTERKAAERMKDEFISVVSHELRTPLTAIRGSLGLIIGGALGAVPPSLGEVLTLAHSNAVRMVTLVNDILDLAKIESGTFEFERGPVEAGQLVERAVAINQSYADQYGVRLVIGPGPAGERVVADGDRIVQVLTNLISNACKFSPRGAEVRIAVAPAPQGGDGEVHPADGAAARAGRPEEWLRFTVQDRGPGIPPEFSPHVFQRFMQADASDHRQKGGTGLGLSIVRSIVEHHGGRVGFERNREGGTTFWFELRRGG